MNETTQATMEMTMRGLLDQGWVSDHPVLVSSHSSHFWLDSPDGEIHAIFDFAEEQVMIVRFRDGLIIGQATFRGAMVAAVYDMLVVG